MDDLLSINKLSDQTPPSLGDLGEKLAADFLIKNGYRLICANFKAPVGRNSKGVQVTGEIDLIALDAEILCFVEVKTRRSDDFTPVITNVDLRKQRQIIRTAKVYRRVLNIYETSHRFDVVTVLMPEHTEPTLHLIQGYWNEAKFRKGRWEREDSRGFY
jgi:putative endonuclease